MFVLYIYMYAKPVPVIPSRLTISLRYFPVDDIHIYVYMQYPYLRCPVDSLSPRAFSL